VDGKMPLFHDAFLVLRWIGMGVDWRLQRPQPRKREQHAGLFEGRLSAARANGGDTLDGSQETLDKGREAGGKGLAVQKIELAPECFCRSGAVLNSGETGAKLPVSLRKTGRSFANPATRIAPESNSPLASRRHPVSDIALLRKLCDPC
jgi:hypothetical protein